MRGYHFRIALGAVAGLMLTGMAQAQQAGTAGAPASAAAKAAKSTAYEQLSPGNRKIADMLFINQTVTGDGHPCWSVEQIAAAKQNGKGWKQIFNQMKAEGLTNAKSLGQLIRGVRHRSDAQGHRALLVPASAGVRVHHARVIDKIESRPYSSENRRYSKNFVLTRGNETMRMDVAGSGVSRRYAGKSHRSGEPEATTHRVRYVTGRGTRRSAGQIAEIGADR